MQTNVTTWQQRRQSHDHAILPLQVVLGEEEYREIQRLARRHRMTVSEWVRQSLRRARQDEPVADAGRKLDVVRSAVGRPASGEVV